MVIHHRTGMLPEPVIERLCILYRTVGDLIDRGMNTASSAELGNTAMIPAYNVRKDLSHLGSSCGTGAGYDLRELKNLLRDSLGFSGVRNVCVVGLGRIGTAVFGNNEYLEEGYRITAGFDSNVNKLELMKTPVPLYPAHEITDRVRELHIDFAVIAVPMDAAQRTADRLIAGGVTGIVNFAPVTLSGVPDNVIVRDVSVLKELRILTAMTG